MELTLHNFQVHSFAYKGRIRNLGVDCSTIGLYFVTITWQKFFKGPLQVTGSAAILADLLLNLAAVLPTLRFSREFGLVFLWICVFLKICGLLVYGLVLIEIFLVFGLVFCRFLLCGLLFFKIFGTFAFLIYCLRHFGRVFVKICSFWACFFGFATRNFYLIFLLIFDLLHFPASAFWACFSVKLPIFGLFFKFTCLFLQNTLASLSSRLFSRLAVKFSI